jgi:DNA-directed RNA polymerase subunit N (RpoN/RPB10)
MRSTREKSTTCREEDSVLRKWSLSRYCCARCILETKTKVGSTVSKDPGPRINPNINETPTAPKSHTHPSHECDGWGRDPEATVVPPTPKTTRKDKGLTRTPVVIVSRHEEDASLRKWSLPRSCCARCILETKTKVGFCCPFVVERGELLFIMKRWRES